MTNKTSPKPIYNPHRRLTKDESGNYTRKKSSKAKVRDQRIAEQVKNSPAKVKKKIKDDKERKRKIAHAKEMATSWLKYESFFEGVTKMAILGRFIGTKRYK